MTAAAESPIEITDVGAASCLYRGDTGALTLLNPAGRELWVELSGGGRPPVADDDAEIRALTTAWRDQGFLEFQPKPIVLDALASLRPPAEPAQPYPLDACYAVVPGRSCRLTVADSQLAALLEAVLAPLACEPAEPVAWIDVLTGDDSHLHLVVDGTERLAGSLAPVRSEVLRHLLLSLIGWDRVGALLHATTIAQDARGICLVGASGSGKSTLAAELIARGCRYVADDLTALDREAKAVHPFPLGLSVKSGSWEQVGRHFPELHEVAPLVTRRLSVRYLDLAERSLASPVPLAAMIFPVYAPSLPLEAERLSPEAALQLAIEAGSAPDGLPRSIHPLVRLCREVPAWHLAYGDAGAAAKWIMSEATDRP